MRARMLAPGLASLLLLAAAAGARDTVGVYNSWGAFRDTEPPRCFAIAQPVSAGASARWRPFASVATWPGRGLRSSFHVRLSRARDRTTAITASIGERHFALVGNATEAWAADGPSDVALVAALRAGRSMSIEAVAAGGPFVDVYALGGAATAIDAAALACSRR